jgi:predicted metal-dependent phosphotriesterase family hydrolase
MGTGPEVPMDRAERTALTAAARLHRRTGLAIVTHTSDGCARCALDQVDLFESAGASLDRVVIGHLNDIKDQPTVVPMGGPGIDMTITNFVPRLRRAGVDAATLRTIIVENPRRVLSFVPRADHD